jgi:hypothetical protein
VFGGIRWIRTADTGGTRAAGLKAIARCHDAREAHGSLAQRPGWRAAKVSAVPVCSVHREVESASTGRSLQCKGGFEHFGTATAAGAASEVSAHGLAKPEFLTRYLQVFRGHLELGAEQRCHSTRLRRLGTRARREANETLVPVRPRQRLGDRRRTIRRRDVAQLRFRRLPVTFERTNPTDCGTVSRCPSSHETSA